MRQKLISFSITYKKYVLSYSETKCFKVRNKVFHTEKRSVSRIETIFET